MNSFTFIKKCEICNEDYYWKSISEETFAELSNNPLLESRILITPNSVKYEVRILSKCSLHS